MPVGWAKLRRRSDRLWLLGAFLLLSLLLVNAWRVPISEKLVPDARLNRKLERAEVALRDGRLSRQDGSGARELFESVLAVDPDQMQARQGLLAVRNAALARADRDLRKRRLEESRRDLGLAEALSAPQVQLQPLRERLQQLEEASVDVPGLLARAAAPGVDDEAALALLDQVLQIDAGNELALEGRRELFSAWLLEAEHDLDAGRVDAARVRIERVLAADPGHVDLPPLRARLADVDARDPRRQAASITPAHAPPSAPPSPAARAASECFVAAMAAGRLRRAGECLERWQALSAGSAAVDNARTQLAERWLAMADERIGASDWKAAREALAAARRWQPGHPRLPALESRLRRAGGA